MAISSINFGNNRFIKNSAKTNLNLVNPNSSNSESIPQYNTKNEPIAFYGKDLVNNNKNSEVIPQELKVLFDNIKDKNGKDFANAAYKGLLKYYKIDNIAPELEWNTTAKTAPANTVSDYAWYKNKVILYENLFLNSGKTKEEQFGFIAHEITHMRQLINVMRTADLPLTKVATAFAIFDFSSNLRSNPIMQKQYMQAKLNGKEKEYTVFIIKQLAQKNYKELGEAFKDILQLPKHPLNSPNGQKALRDLDSWSKYNSSNWETYSNILVEKEAMDEENKMRTMFRLYQNTAQ